jgi:hypothetical protein
VVRKEYVGYYLECKYCDTRLHGTAITSVCSCKTQLLISMFHAMQPPVSIAAGKTGKHPDPKACMQCGTTRTPQWRKGPYGPKTLCNACGAKRVRAIKAQQQGKNAILKLQQQQQLQEGSAAATAAAAAAAAGAATAATPSLLNPVIDPTQALLLLGGVAATDEQAVAALDIEMQEQGLKDLAAYHKKYMKSPYATGAKSSTAAAGEGAEAAAEEGAAAGASSAPAAAGRAGDDAGAGTAAARRGAKRGMGGQTSNNSRIKSKKS